MLQPKKSHYTRTESKVSRPIKEIRGRVESTYNSIGILLDQLSQVAAAFQGQLRQDLSAGIELPAYSKNFLENEKIFEADYAGFRETHGRVGQNAETIRGNLPIILNHCIHLRSCTFTLKVISARYPEISGFAVEMADCVGRIRTSIDRLSDELDRVAVMNRNAGADDVLQSRPSLDEAFRTEPASMRIAAEEIDQMISRLMSTLQCGDIASQRLDHIVQALDVIENAGLADEDHACFMAMLDAQLSQTLSDLDVNCGMFTENFEQIAQRIEMLAENAEIHRSGLLANYQDLEERLHAYFNGLQNSFSWRTNQLAAFDGDDGKSGPARIRTEIFSIGSAVLDIYYMALNTTLSCGRLGGSATSAAPVTSEIRFHVSDMSEAADAMAAVAPAMTEAIDACSTMNVRPDLEESFASEHKRIAAQVHAISERAREVWLSPRKLNTMSQELLAEMPRLHQVANGADAVQETLSAYRHANPQEIRDQRRVEALSQSIFDTYTMNSERETHKRFFWVDVDSSDCDAINLFGDSSGGGDMDMSAVLF